MFDSTGKTTLTVFFPIIFPSESFGWESFSTVCGIFIFLHAVYIDVCDVRTESREMAEKMTLFFFIQVHDPKRLNHSIWVLPSALCHGLRGRQSDKRRARNIDVGVKCPGTAERVLNALVLKFQQFEDILDLLIEPLIEFIIANGWTKLYAPAGTGCQSACGAHGLACAERSALAGAASTADVLDCVALWLVPLETLPV